MFNRGIFALFGKGCLGGGSRNGEKEKNTAKVRKVAQKREGLLRAAPKTRRARKTQKK